MRYGASVSQFLQLSCVPVGARTGRGWAEEAGAVIEVSLI